MATYLQLWKKYSRLIASVAATLTACASIYLFVENVANVSARVSNNTEKLTSTSGSVSNLHERVDTLYADLKINVEQDKQIKVVLDQLVVIAKDNKARIDDLDKRSSINQTITEQLVTIAKENKGRIDTLDKTLATSQTTLDFIKEEVIEIKADVKTHLLNDKTAKVP